MQALRKILESAQRHYKIPMKLGNDRTGGRLARLARLSRLARLARPERRFTGLRLEVILLTEEIYT